MSYVDGFVIALPRKNVSAYQKMSRRAGKIWREYGALQYLECVGDDLNVKMIQTTFPRLVKLKPRETVVFSWIRYKSRAHRDRVNQKVMKDPRIAGMGNEMPFDPKRMSYGGFRTLVEL